MEILANLEKSYDEYKNGKIQTKELNELYESSLKMVKKYFTDGYDADLEKLLLENVEEMDDKGKINESVEGLGKLLKLVETEKVANEDELNNYKNNINESVKKYEKRVKEIEKEEQEKKEAEEQAAKEAAEAAAEAERKAAISNQNNTSNGTSGNSSNNSGNSNNSSSGGSNNGSSSNGDRGPNGWPFIPGTNIEYIEWMGNLGDPNCKYLGIDGDSWYDKNGNLAYKKSDYFEITPR